MGVLAAATAGAQGVAPPTLPPIAGESALPALPQSDSFVIERFCFEGNTVVATATLAAIAEPFTKRPIRVIDLEELRLQLSQAYAERGYVNSGARLSAAGPRDGALCYQLIEGVISQVRLTGMQGLADRYVAARLVRDAEPLNVNTLQERIQLLLGDPLIERLNAQLSPGRTAGEGVLEVEVTRTEPFTATLFANNYRAPAVGSALIGVDAALRNLTGWGDTTSLTLVHSRGSDDYDFGWSIPLNARSTQLTARASRGASAVIEEPLADLDVASIVKSHEIGLSHPLVDRAGVRWVVGVTYSRRRQETTVAGEPFSFVAGESNGIVQARSWRWFHELAWRTDSWSAAGRLTYVDGRSSIIEEPDIPNQPKPAYTLWTAQAQLQLPLGRDGMEWTLRGNVQRSRSRLISMEQLSVGGRYSVRGYRESQLLRDGGYTLGTELAVPVLDGSQGWGRLALVPFADMGYAANSDAAATRIAAAGLGVRWHMAGCDAELYWARRLNHQAIETRGDLQDRGVHLAIRYRAF